MPKWHQVGRAPDTHQPHARPSPLACRALGRRLCPFFRVWAQSLGLWGCVFTCQRMNTGDAWLAQSGLRIPSECPHTGDTRQPQSDNPGAGLGKVSRWQPGVAWQEMGKGKPESPVMSWPVQSMAGTRMRYGGAGLIPGNGGPWGFTSWDGLQRGLGEASG